MEWKVLNIIFLNHPYTHSPQGRLNFHYMYTYVAYLEILLQQQEIYMKRFPRKVFLKYDYACIDGDDNRVMKKSTTGRQAVSLRTN